MAYANIREWAQRRTVAMGGLFRHEGTGRFKSGFDGRLVEVTRLAVGSGGAQCTDAFKAWLCAGVVRHHRAPCAASGTAGGG